VSDQSAIEWTDATWNPVRGCSRVSEGCRNCYAEGVAARFSGPGRPYEGLARFTPHGPQWTGEIRLVPEKLDEPFHWRKPRKVFVNSMSDLFHEDVPDEFIAAVFGVMAAAPQHTFQILTKRAERLPRWFAWLEQMADRAAAVFDEDPISWRRAHILRAAGLRAGVHHTASAGDIEARGWPLPNVWLGVSVENQAAADERIPELLATPAAVRFLSCEPLLGPVNLRKVGGDTDCLDPDDTGHEIGGPAGWIAGPAIDWVIVGGESGRRARPLEVAWARSLVEQCRAAHVPVFVKQLGAVWARESNHYPLGDAAGGDPAEWPEDLRVREMPTPEAHDETRPDPSAPTRNDAKENT
jgi:protein gp37